jgi:hypothetical protein
VILDGPGLVIVGLIAAAAIVGWIGAPLWRAQPADETAEPRVLGLLVEREAALANLRDLESDFAAGRIGPEAYATQRADLVARGAAVLAALEALAATAAERTSTHIARIENEVTERVVAAEGAGERVVARPEPAAR